MNKLHINQDYCKGCFICVGVCPKQAIGVSDRLNSKGYTLPDEMDMGECSGCMLCEMVCPDFAIAVEIYEEACKHGGET